MKYNAIKICSAALMKLGSAGISSFEEGTPEASIAARLYPLVRDGLISSYPWNFALRQVKLNRINEDPVADCKYAYAIPTDALRLMSVGAAGKSSGVEYYILGNNIYTNSSEAILTYISLPQEENFPPFFRDVLVAKLAAEFCLPLTENSVSAQEFAKRAENAVAAARLIDAQQITPRKVQDFNLIGVRK